MKAPVTPDDEARGSDELRDPTERLRAFDWSTTPLGAPEAWPPGLKNAVFGHADALAADRHAAVALAMQSRPEADAVDGPRPRIVLAEDESSARTYIGELLHARYDVVAAVDGASALEKITADRPDLVLADVLMPGAGGLALLRALRANERTSALPVILFSALSREEDRIEAMRAGADDYLVKPFSASELLARIDAGLKIAGVRRVADQAARESEHRLQLAASIGRMGWWEVDLVNDRTYCSPQCKANFGLPPDADVSHGQLFELIHPEDRERIRAVVREATEQHADYQIDCRCLWPDRSLHWLEAKGRAFYADDGTPQRLIGVSVDVTRRKHVEALQAGQRQVLELLATGAPLPAVLETLMHVVEAQAEPGMLASVLLLDADGKHLRHGAAPSLPAAYNAAVDGLEIGPTASPCGTAAHTRQPVHVEDIERDPRWADFVPLARAHGLRACWSTPIISSRGELLGTFAMYYREPRTATTHDLELIELATRTAALAIERKRIEDDLRESEARFRNMADHAAVMVWVTEPDGRCNYLSKSWYAFTGQDEQSGLGFGWLDAVHPEDRPAARDRFLAANADTGPFRLEYRLRRHDGAYRWVWDSAAPRHGDTNEFRGYIGSVLDITDRKRTEEALRESQERTSLAIEVARLGTLRWYPVRDEVVTDARSREICGLGEDNVLRYADVAARIHPDDRQRVHATVQAALDPRGEGRYGETLRWLHADGEIRWTMWRGQALFAGEGAGRKAVQVIASLVDISDSKQAEESLLEADRRKDEFLAILAHELRNPLAPLRNCLHILQSFPVEPAEAARLHTMMARQVTQMVRLVEDLLEVSRITRGNIELRKQRVPLADIIEHAVETSTPLIEASSHRLDINLPEQPLQLDADPARLAQVFSNLLNNAAKYTYPGGRIRLSVHGDDGEAVVSVRDSGAGISPELLPRVFDMFTQGEHSLSEAQGGLGIGLTLVRSLVEMHGGRVEAHSEGLGHGSEFVVRLPLPAQATTDATVVPPPRAEPVHAMQRAVVVDDNPESADSLAMLLQVTGYDVRTAYDGQAAIEFAADFRPDVILLDLGLPKLNGYQVCSRIRAQPWGKDIAIIAVTGWGQQNDRARTEQQGFDAHLVKPVEPDTLLTLVASLRESRKRRVTGAPI